MTYKRHFVVKYVKNILNDSADVRRKIVEKSSEKLKRKFRLIQRSYPKVLLILLKNFVKIPDKFRIIVRK